MKKTRFFSRIFAAALAAVVTATTLITNSGAGLPAFAEGNEGGDGKYKVTIVSPDVPSTGTYTYKFYRIIQGEVEDNDGKNIIANAQWGDAFGNAFTTDEILIARHDADETSEAADLKLTKDQILITSFDSNVQDGRGAYSSDLQDAIMNLYYYFSGENKIDGLYQLYGGDKNAVESKNKFYYVGNTASGALPRTAAGFTEMLNKYATNSSILKAFTDLLYNGIPAGKASDVQQEIKFLDPAYSPTEVAITGTEELTVLVEPGYYLIACVDENGKLTNDGKTKPKPVSAMLLLVGPNEEANTIVGKNTTSVATVDLKMFHETIGLEDLADEDKLGNYVTKKMTWSDAEGSDIFADDKWLDRASYGNLQRSIKYDKPNQYTVDGVDKFDEFVLYRIDVTLPENFESYEDVGYFLAVLGDWNRGGTNPGVSREMSCRPVVYVKHKDGTPEKICEIGYDMSDAKGKGFSHSSINYNVGECNPLGNNDLYIKNGGYAAKDTMYLGDLFNKDVYGEGEDDPETTDVDERTIPFKGGDHIYIYFPAYFRGDITLTDSTRLIKPAHTWAVYSNNPHSTEKANGGVSRASDAKGRYIINGHVNCGDVGISSVPETNINTYSLTVNVTGEFEDSDGKKFDIGYSDYTLYRINDDGEKEYALLYNARVSGNDVASCVGWYTIPQIREYFSAYGSGGVLNGEGDSATIASGNKAINTYYYLNFTVHNTKKVDGKTVSWYRTIDGLAPGTYYIEELSIGTETQPNIKTYNYSAATQPFELVVGQKYNLNLPSATPFDVANKNYLIGELSVDFDQLETKDRTISAEILKPVPNEGATDASKNSVVRNLTDTEAATDDGVVEVLITHKSQKLIWLPETGGIGTTIFFIIGGTIVVAATVLIVTRFRIKRERL